MRKPQLLIQFVQFLKYDFVLFFKIGICLKREKKKSLKHPLNKGQFVVSKKMGAYL